MLDDFLVRAALAGLGVALPAGLLGCFVVWRRMAYFGDATAHAAILGVAVALGLSMSVFAGVLGVTVLMALLLFALSGRRLAIDTVLGVLSHSALALGLVAVALLPGVRVDLSALLFGDVLTVGRTDLAVIWAGGVVVVALLAWRWQGLLAATLSPDLATASGIDPRREGLILTLMLALVVAVAIKVVGALLITALLVIPAAAARPFARTPEAMAALSVAVAGAAALVGLMLAVRFDTPVGPTMVCAAAGFFSISVVLRGLRPISG
jgi:zinc transport system permease protein